MPDTECTYEFRGSMYCTLQRAVLAYWDAPDADKNELITSSDGKQYKPGDDVWKANN